MSNRPSLEIENSFPNMLIAGVDEAGRGPLAGPVVAAAVILPENFDTSGINDSKKVSAKNREILYDRITTQCTYSVSIISEQQIDEINILNATKLAMQKAIESLSAAPHIALIDGNAPPKLSPQTKAIAVVKGDSKSLSIAAASIVAKVTRDRIMQNLCQQFPEYQWSKNAGYGTKSHIDAITTHGISPHHRKTFAPIKNMI